MVNGESMKRSRSPFGSAVSEGSEGAAGSKPPAATRAGGGKFVYMRDFMAEYRAFCLESNLEPLEKREVTPPRRVAEPRPAASPPLTL